MGASDAVKSLWDSIWSGLGDVLSLIWNLLTQGADALRDWLWDHAVGPFYKALVSGATAAASTALDVVDYAGYVASKVFGQYLGGMGIVWLVIALVLAGIMFSALMARL